MLVTYTNICIIYRINKYNRIIVIGGALEYIYIYIYCTLIKSDIIQQFLWLQRVKQNRNTMSGRKLAPPIYSKNVNYKVWKNKLDMWKIVCVIPRKEQGIIVLLQSIGDNKKAKKAVSTLTVQNKETGLNVLIEKLDNAFKNEIVEDTYSIYLKFTDLKKQPSMSMNDYIIEFENLNHEMNIHNMALPDTVLAFKMLEGAMLNDNQ